MAKINRIKSTDIVRQSNKITHANSSYTVLEEKLFTMIFSKLTGRETELPPLAFSTSDVCKALGTKSEDMRPALVRLTTKPIMTGDINDLTQEWTAKMPIISVAHKSGTVELILNPLLKPFFLNVATEFTSYEAEKTYRLSSRYSIRLYKMIMQWKSKLDETPVFPLELDYQELRERFQLKDTQYKMKDNFRRKLLMPAIDDINDANLGIHVELGKPNKIGRTIFDFILNVSKTKPGTAKKVEAPKTARKLSAEEKANEEKYAFIEAHIDEYNTILSEILAQPDLDGMPEELRGNPIKKKKHQADEAYKELCRRYKK